MKVDKGAIATAVVSKTLRDLLGFGGFLCYSMFSFTNAHTAVQTALCSEYNNVH